MHPLDNVKSVTMMPLCELAALNQELAAFRQLCSLDYQFLRWLY